MQRQRQWRRPPQTIGIAVWIATMAPTVVLGNYVGLNRLEAFMLVLFGFCVIMLGVAYWQRRSQP
jgi:hypothetical protein